MADRVGQQFGNYRLVALLGQGGYAKVYLGQHVRLELQAAIKVLHTHLTSSEAERFQHEAETIARLAHPAIVRVVDYDVQEGVPFLVMDYAPGGSLRQRYPKGSQVPLPLLMASVKQVAAALQYAHERKVIHRDVKPENMLLGRQQEVLLSDFGLATPAQSRSSLNMSTQATAGTIAYMAPEQIEGHPHAASDQYALGVVVYEWLCGARPFGGSPSEVMVQHLSLPPPPLRERVPTLSDEMEQIVLQALAKDPKERFASVQVFALALEGAIREESSGRTFQVLSTDHPIVSKQASKHNLPTQLTSLLGREQEVAAACALLRRPEVRLLTLTGTPGIGKTRLGLQVAADLLADFADGVCFVQLAPISDPELVVPTIAQLFDIKEAGDWSLLERLQSHLQEKHLLLLLDNFEQIISSAPSLAELLAVCPHLKILVTSRAVLHIQGEQEFPVPPLAVPVLAHLPEHEALAAYAAVALFLQRAQAVKPGFQLTKANARAVAAICARLDGLPLAIELAAARIKLLPPQALLTRLEHQLQMLTGGPQNMPVRQQTLGNTIAWSYNLLGAREQKLFRLLSVFVGGCTLEAAEVVCGALSDSEEAVSILDGIASLLDKSLLKQTEQDDEPRLLMLEMIREYGLEALAASGEMEVTQQVHVNYYLNLAEEGKPYVGGPEEAMWMERLEREHDNLRAAMQWTLARGEASEGRHSMETALRLGVALARFWGGHDHLTEARDALKRALARSEGAAPLLRAKALEAACSLAGPQADIDGVEELCGESLALFRELGDKQGTAFSLFWLGAAAEYNGDLARERKLLEEALALFREVGNKEFIGWSYRQLGTLEVCQGEYTRATALLEKSLAIHRELGSTTGIADLLYTLAHLLFFTGGNLGMMRTLAEEGFARARELGNPGLICESVISLAFAALAEGDTARARMLLEQALGIARESDHRGDLTAQVLILLGKVAVMQGDDALALRLYQQALTSAVRLDIPECLEGVADVASRQGEPRWAAQLWGTAESLREARGTPIFPVWRANYERSVVAAHAQIGEKTFTAAWAEGRMMSCEQAMAAKGQVTMPTTPEPSSTPLAKRRARYPAGLTAREVEVLCLIAQGLTDTEVAEQLVISPRTVNTHLTAIYGKIGVSSRSAATRYAIEHHLI